MDNQGMGMEWEGDMMILREARRDRRMYNEGRRKGERRKVERDAFGPSLVKVFEADADHPLQQVQVQGMD